MTETAPVVEEVGFGVSKTKDPESHDRFAHVIVEGYWVSAEGGGEKFVASGNDVVGAYLNQTPLRALCGKTWVPRYDPKRYPVCPECKEIAKGLGVEVD